MTKEKILPKREYVWRANLYFRLLEEHTELALNARTDAELTHHIRQCTQYREHIKYNIMMFDKVKH